MMNHEQADVWLQREFPFIRWREPITISARGQTRIGCRLCIAKRGLVARDLEISEFTFRSKDEFDAHMAWAHRAAKEQ